MKFTLTACLGAAFVLAGCASTVPDHFYTLGGDAAAPTAAAAVASKPVYIEMLGVTVPAQVRRNQLVAGRTSPQIVVRRYKVLGVEKRLPATQLWGFVQGPLS